MEYLILGLAVIVIAVALSFFANLFKKAKPKNQSKTSNQNKSQNGAGGPFLVTCPMCGSPLPKGDNLVTKVYRPMNVPDQRCTINGCPHCYPRPEPGIRRQCPCCKKEVPLNGYLIARLFNYKNNKKHVMVTGCSECCKK
ncbi:MAG: hypothetical protein KBT21_09465 [Treponema sp.]|nr:hypothetical protein [Candidatus Treponema merdequi]